jgi:hypothetical protein
MKKNHLITFHFIMCWFQVYENRMSSPVWSTSSKECSDRTFCLLTYVTILASEDSNTSLFGYAKKGRVRKNKYIIWRIHRTTLCANLRTTLLWCHFILSPTKWVVPSVEEKNLNSAIWEAEQNCMASANPLLQKRHFRFRVHISGAWWGAATSHLHCVTGS